MKHMWLLLLLTPFLAGASHQIFIPEAAQAPVLDGRDDDPCWQNAAVIFGFTDSQTHAPAAAQTVLKLVKYKDKLYGIALCKQPGADKLAETEKPYGKMPFMTSSLELFFTNGSMIYQFVFNYAEKVFRQQLRPEAVLGPRPDTSYTGEIDLKCAVSPSGWTAEFAIALKSLHLTGNTFGMNVVRNDLSARETSLWMSEKTDRGGWAGQYKHFPRAVFGDGPAPAFTVSGQSVTAKEDLENLSWPDRTKEIIRKGTVLTLARDREFRLNLVRNGRTVYRYTFIPPEKVTLALGDHAIDWPVLHFSSFLPCQIVWQSNHAFPVDPKNRATGRVDNRFELIFDVPEGITLLNGVKQPQAKPGRDVFILKRDYLNRVQFKNEIRTLFGCTLPPGTRDVLRYQVRWPEGRTAVHEIPIASVEVKPARPPKKVLIGLYGAHDGWTEQLQQVGINLIAFPYYHRRDEATLKEIRRLREKGFQVAFSSTQDIPFGSGKFFGNWTENDRSARSVDIDGYYIINPKSKVYQISPSYRGKLFQEGLKATREYCRKAGFRIYCFDTEDFFQGAGEKGDFSDRTIRWFEKWFKEKYAGKEYISPKIFERTPDEYPEHHRAWVDFKCEIWADFFQEIKKSMNISGDDVFIDYGMREVDEETCHQRLTDYHWLKVFDGGIGGGWYSGVDRSVRAWDKVYDDMNRKWHVEPVRAAWINPARLLASFSATTAPPVKDEMKCKLFEAMSMGVKSYHIFAQRFMDMDSVRQLSEAIRVLEQCEEIVYAGKPIAGLTTDVPYYEKLQDYYELRKLTTWKNQPKVLVRGMEYNGRALITVSEYREQTPRKLKVFYTFRNDCTVKDLETGEIVASPKAGEKFFPAELDAERCCRIYLISPDKNGTNVK